MESGGNNADGKLLEVTAGGYSHNHTHTHHHHPHTHLHLLHPQLLRTLLLFAVVAVSCLVVYRSSYPFHFLPTSLYRPLLSHDSARLPPSDTLERVLARAAMADKTVIITTLNEAWAAPDSVFDLFLESFRHGNQTQELLSHLVVIALDQKAYARCIALHPHCYALTTKGVDFSGREAYFMTTDYLKMMWRRIDFLHSVLRMRYNFVFTDADIMWFRDPFPRFYPNSDFQIACDRFLGNATDLNNSPNGGFIYVKSNNRTINFYKFWYSSRKTHPGLHDQDVLNKIKHDDSFKKIGLQIRFLDTAYFGGFCEPSKDFDTVCTMHANCCFGLASKIHDLRLMLQDWRKYMSLPTHKRTLKKLSWTVPQNCSLSSLHPPNVSKKNGKQGKKRQRNL